MATEKQKIRQWFRSHKYLTVAQAIHRLGVYNLRSRASEMPDIAAEMITVTRADGVKARVARYWSIYNLPKGKEIMEAIETAKKEKA